MPNMKMSKKEKLAASDAAEAAIAAEAVAAATSIAVNLTAIKASPAAIAEAWAVANGIAEKSKARRFDFVASVPTLEPEAQAAVDALLAKAAAKAERFKAWAAKKAATKARRLAPIKEEKGRGGKTG
jgi:hypothetical protein